MLARVEAASVPAPSGLPRTRGLGDRIGDALLYGLTAFAAILGIVVVFAIIWRVADGAWPAIKAYKLSFLWHDKWNAPLNEFGARDFIIGTIVTSFGAMLLSAPLSIAIGLFLSSLTTYQIVAAIITFAILFLLSQAGDLFQDVDIRMIVDKPSDFY